MMTKRGFSLLEVLIAMTILAIGVIGAMRLFPMTLRQVRGAQERTVASELADDLFSRLRSAGGHNLFDAWSTMAGEPVFNLLQANDIYSNYTTSVSLVSGGTEVYLHRATINVKMPDGRYERFVTFIGEP
ncbi:MAG TPA: type IV pilus modification protein PilV [Candidatus Hydrogenedentes bacterium]|nr:type IV pilus modification protein PilV [Candidatus Hydrogenedentota bacterium]HPO85264.1 type IV pilus modification protein PilV [Candidatus Hydrogenedentota bacterium]